MTDDPRRMTPAEHAAAEAAFRSSITIIDGGFMSDDPRAEAAAQALFDSKMGGTSDPTLTDMLAAICVDDAKTALAAADAVALAGADELKKAQSVIGTMIQSQHAQERTNVLQAARIAALEAAGWRLMSCWNNYHGDLGSQQPGAQRRADEIDWPALNLAMESFAEILGDDDGDADQNRD